MSQQNKRISKCQYLLKKGGLPVLKLAVCIAVVQAKIKEKDSPCILFTWKKQA